MTDDRPAKVNSFANKIARYVESGPDYENWDKHRAVVEAVTVLFQDIGAANEFLNVFGLKVDLYESSIEELNARLERKP